jgi:hypothetical protein
MADEITSTDRYQNYNQSILKIRLDSAEVLERVRIYLTGKIQTVVYDEKGKPFIRESKIADQKANDEGMQWLLNYVENIVNSQAVQGNFTFDQYQRYIDEVHSGLILNVMHNLIVWNIKDDNYEAIIDTIMNVIQPFISRLVNNEERKSYIPTMQVRESSTIEQIPQQKKGLFK